MVTDRRHLRGGVIGGSNQSNQRPINDQSTKPIHQSIVIAFLALLFRASKRLQAARLLPARELARVPPAMPRTAPAAAEEATYGAEIGVQVVVY